MRYYYCIEKSTNNHSTLDEIAVKRKESVDLTRMLVGDILRGAHYAVIIRLRYWNE